jgi:excisionase family DNA binding protein
VTNSETPFKTPAVSLSGLVEPILTPEQVAERLQLPSSKTVYEMTRRRSSGRRPMPFFKVGKFLRFKWSEIERWMEEGRKSRAA